LTRLQKQAGDEDRSRVVAGREFQAAAPQTDSSRQLLCDP